MKLSPRLLLTTSVSPLNAAAACDARYPSSRRLCEIFLMLKLTWQRLLSGNLRKASSPATEALVSSYLDLVVPMDDPATRKGCRRARMEPYVDACYSQNTTSTATVCDVPSFTSAPSSNMRYCADSVHRTSACATDIKYGNHIDKQRYKSLRKWKRLGKDRASSNAEDAFMLRLLSFNILAQNLLEDHSYLYMNHNKKALNWKIRKPLVIQEILDAEANVICLQEVQEDHLLDITTSFKQLRFDYLYKKRTNDKRDGLLLLYRSDHLVLMEYAKVELYQSGVELLNRDNVGMIAKFALRDSPQTQIVVATTHLLYNPKRNDVRLAQVQLLLAEIERIAFVENTISGPKYLPILLAGDFNLEPFTGVYKFLTEGVFEYYGKGRSLEPTPYCSLSNSLIPPRLCVTDNCQHFNILTQRLRREGTGRVMLQNSEVHNENTPTPCNINVPQQGDVNVDTSRAQIIEIVQGHSARFSSGTLTHPFNLSSVYAHVNHHGEKEATTHQDEWVTVDYIFYSNIQPVERYSLPTVNQCAALSRIPNFVVGSDHLCIGATFQLPKKKFLL
ncbi:protein angel isoform X2 [Ooceraea biroi]|uniref:protein angel isoform X2 n=1 Tax=Ooceraea biroi TaxID=2015173 RepID=UPI0005B87CE6|nr:protein angel isoform X2 [Ooceraea biroi]